MDSRNERLVTYRSHIDHDPTTNESKASASPKIAQLTMEDSTGLGTTIVWTARNHTTLFCELLEGYHGFYLSLQASSCSVDTD